jgi:hypothetical protein
MRTCFLLSLTFKSIFSAHSYTGLPSATSTSCAGNLPAGHAVTC